MLLLLHKIGIMLSESSGNEINLFSKKICFIWEYPNFIFIANGVLFVYLPHLSFSHIVSAHVIDN